MGVYSAYLRDGTFVGNSRYTRPHDDFPRVSLRGPVQLVGTVGMLVPPSIQSESSVCLRKRAGLVVGEAFFAKCTQVAYYPRTLLRHDRRVVLGITMILPMSTNFGRCSPPVAVILWTGILA